LSASPAVAPAGPDQPAARRAPRVRLAAWMLGGSAAAAVTLGAYLLTVRPDGGALPPPLPDLSDQPAAIRLHLIEADAAARAQPDTGALEALCVAYHADMFYDEAVACYAAAGHRGGDWRLAYLTALAEGARGDSEAHIGELKRVTESAPEFAPAWLRLGEAEFKRGRADAAEANWIRAQSLAEPARPPGAAESPARRASAPVSAHAAIGLARLALARGDSEQARQLLEPVTDAVPRFGPAFRLLADAYQRLGRPDDASRATRRADTLPSTDPYVDPVVERLAGESRSATYLLQQAAATDVATGAAWREHLIRRALDADPDNADAAFELASLLRVLRRYEEALDVLVRYERLVPDDYQALADRGRCLSGLGRFAEAEAVLRRALEGLDDANTRYDLGLAIDRQNRPDAAVAQYRLALERNPNHRDALNNLGVALARQGRLAQAIQQFERLAGVDPDNADAHTNLGSLLMAQGRREMAERAFRTALALRTDHALALEGLRRLER
jgi:tetratricopeptide (TPR) repeat protein